MGEFERGSAGALDLLSRLGGSACYRHAGPDLFEAPEPTRIFFHERAAYRRHDASSHALEGEG